MLFYLYYIVIALPLHEINIMNKKAILFFSILALSFSALFTSCRINSDGDNTVSTLANVMVVNASPGSTGLDFYIDNSLQNGSGIAYGTNSGYLQSTTGMKNLRLNKANTAVNLIDRDEDFDLNGSYTLLTLDTVSSIESMLLNDDLSEPVLGKSHIRFVHASHNSPAIDIVNLADTSVVFANIGFRQYAAFTPVDAGTYALGYRLLGDSNIASLPTPVTLSNQGIYTIVASGFNTDTSGTAVTSLDIRMIDNTP